MTTAPWVDGEDINAQKMYDRTTALLAALEDTGWQSVGAMGGSWVADTNAPKYRRENGITTVKGWAKNGTTGSTMFTLPAGYRPTEEMWFLGAANGSGDGFARIAVNAAGVVSVQIYGSGGSNVRVVLDSISFHADA